MNFLLKDVKIKGKHFKNKFSLHFRPIFFKVNLSESILVTMYGLKTGANPNFASKKVYFNSFSSLEKSIDFTSFNTSKRIAQMSESSFVAKFKTLLPRLIIMLL